jgi:hypothetical protein
MKPKPYCVWKAEELNRLFEAHGVLQERGRISPKTVEDGLDKFTKKTGKPAPK